MAIVVTNSGEQDSALPEKRIPPSYPMQQKSSPPSYPPNLPPVAAGGSSSVGGGRGFFTIYKKGQGFWTRIGTVAAAALIGLLTAGFIYEQLPGVVRPLFLPSETSNVKITPDMNAHATNMSRNVTLGICAGFMAVYCLIGFMLTNRPSNADFLIATDSEMKKVNWTSRKELIGSTRVVILFVVCIAVILFVYDLFFHTLFYLLHVLSTPPPFWPVK